MWYLDAKIVDSGDPPQLGVHQLTRELASHGKVFYCLGTMAPGIMTCGGQAARCVVFRSQNDGCWGSPAAGGSPTY